MAPDLRSRLPARFATSARSAWWLIAAAAAAGCDGAPTAASPAATATARPASPEALATVAVSAEERALDARADGDVLVGRALDALPDSDAPPTFRVRWVARGSGGVARPFALAEAPLQDARFVPGTDGVVALTPRGELLWLATPEAAPVRVDEHATGPLAVAAQGRYVAYARGEMPDYELARVDLATMRVEALTTDMAPAWCPALSPDGRALLFVSGVTGSPALYRLDPGGAPRMLTPRGARVRLPMGPTAPVWLGDALLFDDEGAVRRVGLDGVDRGVVPAAALGGAR